MGDELQDYFKTAVAVAKEAGERVKHDFNRNKSIEMKENFADLVTETDQAVEKLIMDRLIQKYPSHKFIGEETVAAGLKCDLTDEPTWIVDPIDGTMNFVHRVPYTSISIALAVEKKIVVGIVYAPMMGEMYSAVKGQGAHCNDDKLSVSTMTELSKCLAIIEGGTSRVPEILQTKMENIQNLVSNCHGVRAYGSAALNLCMVAKGTHELYVEHGIHVWDIAAGKIIVEEAGGVTLDTTCGPVDICSRRILAACNTTVAQQAAKYIKNCHFDRD